MMLTVVLNAYVQSICKTKHIKLIESPAAGPRTRMEQANEQLTIDVNTEGEFQIYIHGMFFLPLEIDSVQFNTVDHACIVCPVMEAFWWTSELLLNVIHTWHFYF